ncbi:MAG: hypothetical protein AB1894_27810 [Chloroflexota bacterium]
METLSWLALSYILGQVILLVVWGRGWKETLHRLAMLLAISSFAVLFGFAVSYLLWM